MASQGKSGKYTNDYEELIYSSCEDLIEILQNDEASSKKLQSLNILISKFSSSPVEKSFGSNILHEIMPFVKKLLESLLEKTVELSTDNQSEKCLDTLELIQQNLEMVVQLLSTLDVLMLHIISKSQINLTSIQTLPSHIGDILYATFLHCKESNNIYLIYFDSLNEIMLIFKKSQEIHVKLLTMLESYVIFTVSNPEQVSSLEKVLDNLVNIGTLLSGMNVKSMANNWKGFLNLTQKYTEILAKTMDFKRPLELLTNEILTNLKGVFEMDLQDTTTITYTLKIGNFLVKVIVKLCLTFWENVKSGVGIFWQFFADLYGYTAPTSKFCPDQVLDLITTYLINALEPLIEQFSMEKEFCQLNEINSESKLCSYGYLLFINKLFSIWVDNLSKCAIDQYHLHVHIKNIICCLGKQTNYVSTSLMTNIPILIIKSNQTLLKEILSQHLFDFNVVISIFIQDIWLSVIRLSGLKNIYSVLCNLADKFKPFLSSRFSNYVHIPKLSRLLKSLFTSLDDNYKTQFITRYPIIKNLPLWKAIGLSLLPDESKSEIEALLSETTQYIESFLAGKITLEQFFIMVDLLVVASTIDFNRTAFDLNKLSPCVIQLWTFKFSEELTESPFFNILMEAMVKITSSLLWKLNIKDLLQVCDILKLATEENNLSRLLSVGVIKKICTEGRMNDVLIPNITAILTNMLTSNSTILRKEGFILITRHLKSPIKNAIIDKISEKKPIIKTIMNRKVNAVKPIDLLKLQNGIYSHKCLEWGGEPKAKKIKMDENSEISKVLSKLKEDVNDLKELLRREPLKTENVAVIRGIVTELNLCLK